MVSSFMIPASAYPSENDLVQHTELASAIRVLAIDAVEAAKSGHPGMPMGMADVATVLFTKFLKYDPKHPTWADRDRFVLSAGHGSMLLYALLYLTGYERMTIEQLKNFRQMHAITTGHPEVMPEAGIEMTTGPLGAGISTAVGMALAERMMNARFSNALVDHHTYVICSDGDLMEGVSHEACSLAGHLALNKLIVLYDDNKISIDGPTSLSFSENIPQRFESYGWRVWQINGHDPLQIEAAIHQAKESDRPSMICCQTTIGYGAPTKANTSGIHGSPLGAVEIEGARLHYNWPHEPFHIPERILNAWRAHGSQHGEAYAKWQRGFDATGATLRKSFQAALDGVVPDAAKKAFDDYKKKVAADKPAQATRVSSGHVLDQIVPVWPELIGGSADLTGSVNTRVKNAGKAVAAHDYDGRYVHYGVREHGMTAMMNGMALHGGFIPYGGTFLTFADYCRPSIRLAALMRQRVVFVMTHDSIGLGEDGPTHQPIEHLASLRAIPNLLVFRPADAMETAECWQAALENTENPSIMTLTRQNLPALRDYSADNKSAWGGYIIRESKGEAAVAIIATGSEVEIAVAAQDILQKDGIAARVVSLPCWELFDMQDADYREKILGRDTLKVGIEAACSLGWHKYLGTNGIFIGIDTFGESAPYQELYKHFGLTAVNVANQVRQKLKSN